MDGDSSVSWFGSRRVSGPGQRVVNDPAYTAKVNRAIIETDKGNSLGFTEALANAVSCAFVAGQTSQYGSADSEAGSYPDFPESNSLTQYQPTRDAAGNLIQVVAVTTMADGTVDGPKTTTYTYDEKGRISSIVDSWPGSDCVEETLLEYNSKNQLTKSTLSVGAPGQQEVPSGSIPSSLPISRTAG